MMDEVSAVFEMVVALFDDICDDELRQLERAA